MLIQGSSNNTRFNLLVEEYLKLYKSGIKPENILALFLNSYKKAEFINALKQASPDINLENNKIYTFWGLCYNSFKDNWDYISKLIGVDEKKTPNLCGLEVSQYIFKQSIKTADFSDYISKINLLHQLFRRYSLSVQNMLTNTELKTRSEILNEVFYKDAQKAIDDYKLKTIEYNSFDYLRQLAVLPLIYKNTDYFKKIEYLIIDDADEFSFAFWQFIFHIMPFIKNYIIAFDKYGSTRAGYLCAYKNGINDFISKYNPKILETEETSPNIKRAEELYNAIKQNEKVKDNIKTASKRLDMLEIAILDLKELMQRGIKPNDIAVITPIVDDVLIRTFGNIKFQILSGSEKLESSNTIRHLITILKLINGINILDYELKGLLIDLLKIPYKKCSDIIRYYNKEQILPIKDFTESSYDYGYKKLFSLISAEKKHKNTLTEQIKIIYTNILKNLEQDLDNEKYDFMLKEAESFETAFSSLINNTASEFITQIENTVISENAADSVHLSEDCVIISSPQKLADMSIHTKYQIWLDISNNEWMKQDTGTLYNAWVLSRDWEKSEYSIKDNILLTQDRTARIVRKLMFCAKENITMYASIYDNTGNENFGGIADFIESKEQNKKSFNILPRNDQKPVLEYTKGKLGIMAVPGAGKTTILLLLILKLIKQGINPENIFVLTYMESAAKNFKDKLLPAIPENINLPNISTIHGLALRIIKENGNYTKAGLDDNFEICDDITKERIIKELFYNFKIDEEKYDNYLKCISIVKLSGSNNPHSKYKEIQDFYNFYKQYNNLLKSKNLIDYDDMLYYAVKILEENKDILNYYQNICQYIIEDEAQDSSDIQQKLIALLNGKYNNIVRCGDINQAITSTFTNSNPESFKSFILNGHKVEMVSSQRCAEPIYNFANKLIEFSSKNENLKKAFYPIKMIGTSNNPKSDKQPEYITFDDEKDEKNYIYKQISEILNTNPKASIAILLRLNSQVEDYNEYFLNKGLKTSVRTDCLVQKNIYKTIITILKIIQNPYNNKQICDLAKEYSLSVSDIDYIKTLKSPFIETNPDEIESEKLLQLYWDIDYRLNFSAINTDILVLDTGLYYSKDTADKSNTYMISAMVKRLTERGDSLENIIKKLEYAAQKPASAYKFFENISDDENIASVNIMTMHKAKGDEFDFVFIPELNEDNYSTDINRVKLKSGSHFVQTIKNTTENCGMKTPEELKKEQVFETLRLLYVGITRAKKELYLTNSNNYKKRKNTKDIEIIKNLY